jgi:hypothetical protein
VYQRFAIAGLLVPVVVIGLIVAAAVTSTDDTAGVGSCIRASADGTHASAVACSEQHDGIVTQVVRDSADCPSNGIGVLRNYDGADDTRVLCVGQG